MDENVNRFGAFDIGKLKIVVESNSLIVVAVTGKYNVNFNWINIF